MMSFSAAGFLLGMIFNFVWLQIRQTEKYDLTPLCAFAIGMNSEPKYCTTANLSSDSRSDLCSKYNIQFTSVILWSYTDKTDGRKWTICLTPLWSRTYYSTKLSFCSPGWTILNSNQTPKAEHVKWSHTFIEILFIGSIQSMDFKSSAHLFPAEVGGSKLNGSLPDTIFWKEIDLKFTDSLTTIKITFTGRGQERLKNAH